MIRSGYNNLSSPTTATALLCQSCYAVFVGMIAKSYVTMLLLTVGSTGLTAYFVAAAAISLTEWVNSIKRVSKPSISQFFT